MSARKTSTSRIILLLLPGAGSILLFVIIVMIIILSESFGIINTYGDASNTGFTLAYWKATLSDTRMWRFFIYSFRQGMLSAFGAVLLAYPFALWFRKSFRGSFLLSGIMRIPMLIPGLVAAFLFLNVIAYHGILNELLMALRIIKEPLRIRNDKYGIGIIVLQIWKQMPFALLFLTGTVKSISADVIDSARDFGANKITLIRKIIFPLTLSAMRVVLVLVFIGALGDFSFNIVAGPQRLQSISQHIFILRAQLFKINEAAVVSILLLVASIIGAGMLGFITKIFEVKREVKA